MLLQVTGSTEVSTCVFISIVGARHKVLSGNRKPPPDLASSRWAPSSHLREDSGSFPWPQIGSESALSWAFSEMLPNRQGRLSSDRAAEKQHQNRPCLLDQLQLQVPRGLNIVVTCYYHIKTVQKKKGNNLLGWSVI